MHMIQPNPNSIAADEAGAHFSDVLKRVENGEEVTITREGTPVARMVPVRQARTPEEIEAAMDEWEKVSAGLSLGGLKIKDLINEGR
jgi:prevent-host-death family protein